MQTPAKDDQVLEPPLLVPPKVILIETRDRHLPTGPDEVEVHFPWVLSPHETIVPGIERAPVGRVRVRYNFSIYTSQRIEFVSSDRFVEPYNMTTLKPITCRFSRPPGQQNKKELVAELLYWGIGNPTWSGPDQQERLRPKKLYLTGAMIEVNDKHYQLHPDLLSLSNLSWTALSTAPPWHHWIAHNTASHWKASSVASDWKPSSTASHKIAFSTFHSKASSIASYRTARSTASYRTSYSTASFTTARSNSRDFQDENDFGYATIKEVDEMTVPKGPLKKLELDYQAELKQRQLFQPFDKELNWSGKGQHVVFEPREKIPLTVLSHLGASATAHVERVLCRRVALARKTMRCKGNWTRNNVLEEVSHLQNLRHFHIVQLVGTYLQGREFSLLMYPAADCHLGKFMEDTEDMKNDLHFLKEYEARRMFLCVSLHCLASAVECIHRNSTKHMDIKPQNILVKAIDDSLPGSCRIYVSDFGLSRSFADQGHSQTDGPTSLTRKYCAPEVAEFESRGRSSDIFSLGRVYTEMLTVIAGNHGRGLADFVEFRRDEDGDASFHKHIEKVACWMHENSLRTIPTAMRDFILRMLDVDPKQRPPASEIMRCTSFMRAEMPDRICCERQPEPYVAYHQKSEQHSMILL
ncbi:serine threonine kinase [Paraphaeosphaeria minitans]|uniref:Serine threonine kinase n=1 Tax=Paraphaeosphaeria minitans TaxID=565426 RepID=A0A9P6KT15_9PLEO|nr:serine threonine kinase [Paraphaeosphaeria minitans]